MRSHSLFFRVCSVGLLGWGLTHGAWVDAGEWDYNTGIGYRHEPLGLAANATVGFGQTLWDKRGKNSSSLSKILYGFIRPQIRVQTSGIVNSFDGRIEIFPISLVGLVMGQNVSYRSTDFAGVPCQQVSCQGSVQRSFVMGQAAMGYGDFALISALRLDSLQQSGTQIFAGSRFYDESSSLIADATGDSLLSIDLAGIYKVSSAVDAGVLYSLSEFTKSTQRSQLASLIGFYGHGPYKYGAGLGSYSSNLVEDSRSSPTFFLSLKWTPRSSPGLF